MLILSRGTANEVAVRVFLESDSFGTEFFDGYDSLAECAAAVARLAQSAVTETTKDGVARQVGIAIVPKAAYELEEGFDQGIEHDE